MSPWPVFRELFYKIVFQVFAEFWLQKTFKKPPKNHDQTMKKSIIKMYLFLKPFYGPIVAVRFGDWASKSSKFRSQNHYFSKIAFWSPKSRALRVDLGPFGAVLKVWKAKNVEFGLQKWVSSVLIITLRIIWHELKGFQKIFVHTLGNEIRLQGIPDESIESLTNQDRPGGLRAAL